MKNFTLKTLVKYAFVVFFTSPLSIFAMPGGGGGSTGPSFSDSAPGSSSGCGAGTLDNSKATVAKACHPDTYDFSVCPAEYEDCQFAIKGALCEVSTCTCWGSMENNIWSQFCAPATGTFVFEVTNVVCSGGGSSLQFFIAPTPSDGFSSVCDLSAVYCDKGSTGDQSHSVDLTSGQCYTLMFDGNAGAACTWDFNINCSYALGIIMLDYGVELSDVNNTATVYWEVTDENNVDYYSIERSSDGVNFESIGKVLPKNDPDKRLNYSFVDSNPINGTSYYRLKEIDIDEKQYTYKRLALNNKNQTITLYPNPITDDLNINFEKELMPGTVVAVYNVLGNVVYYTETTEKSSELKIDMDDCSKGIYFLSIKSGENIIQQKFFKD